MPSPNDTTANPPPNTATSAVAPKQSGTAPDKPKYTPEQQAAAEKKVQANAVKRQKEIDEFIEDFSKKLLEFVEGEDGNTRTSIIDRIAQRARSIRTVAANAKKLAPRSAIMAEEKATMPRLVSGESRNILAQGDQNKTDINAGGDKK